MEKSINLDPPTRLGTDLTNCKVDCRRLLPLPIGTSNKEAIKGRMQGLRGGGVKVHVWFGQTSSI